VGVFRSRVTEGTHPGMPNQIRLENSVGKASNSLVDGALVHSTAGGAEHTRAGALATCRQPPRRRAGLRGGRVVRSNGRAPSLVVSRAASSSGCAPPCRTATRRAGQLVTLRGTERPAHVTWKAEAAGRVRAGHEPEVWYIARVKLALLALPNRHHLHKAELSTKCSELMGAALGWRHQSSARG